MPYSFTRISAVLSAWVEVAHIRILSILFVYPSIVSTFANTNGVCSLPTIYHNTMPPASDPTVLAVPNSVHLPLASDLPPLHKRVPSELGGKPHVSFHQVQVRRFPMIAGDNPACMVGVPVTIDWGYEELPPLDLNAFESIRQNNRRRKVHHLLLSCVQRQRILLGIGYSDSTIAEVEKDIAVVRYQRHMTRLSLPFFKVHDLWETLKRKLQRQFNGDIQRDKIAVDTAIRELRRQDYMLKARRDVQKRALSTGLQSH